MRERVVWRPIARQDLLQAALYIARDDPSAGIRFVDAVAATTDMLLDAPGLGRLREFTSTALTGLRSHLVKNFENHLVSYRAVESGIEILRVLHGARDLEALFRYQQ